ncbi:type VI secretion [Chlorella sorokiniana]|uniref:Type VI secretion n=1 Tax=Chlorella sorokiniana TaxID=3076 RepID=A0A2P6TWQ3_CHLSO|nr:type VI secretion [Chlorella sorokiniana]|eukprot:PRW58493.1 type VI secretion [Chlorella sorokiniana]
MANRVLTIIACFFLGFGVFWLNGTGFIPPVVSQILMVMWVLLMRSLAMPKVVEASKEAFGLHKAAEREGKDEAAASAPAAPSSGKSGRKGAGKRQAAAAAATSKKDE